MYRITFYSIPFMRGGLNVPAFPAGEDPATVLTPYKIAEYVTARPFSETQDTLIIPDGLTVADSTANYVRVALCASETAPIEEDRAPSYYWAENIDMLGEQADGTVPVRVEIVPDPWGTDFFPSSAKVSGRIAQTTYISIAGTQIAELPTPSQHILSMSEKTIKTNAIFGRADSYIPIAIAISESGTIYAITTRTAQSGGTLGNTLSRFGQIAKLVFSETLEIVCATSRLYVVPEAMFNSCGGERLSVGFDVITADNETVENCVQFSIQDRDQTGTPKTYEFSIPNYELSSMYILRTPRESIPIKDIVINASGARSPIIKFFMAINNSFELSVGAYINGEMYDISDDFSCDFAVNDAALKQVQQKELYALTAIANGVGAVGGVVGGVSSGNYFGALQSAVGGVNGIASMMYEKRTPATVKGTGAGMTAIFSAGLISIMEIPAINKNDVYYEIETYGYILTDTPTRLELPRYENNFYRYESINEITNMTGGEAAKREIASALLQGVRFKTL